MNFAVKRGWVPALVAGVLGVMFWVPPDPVTEILTLILTFALTVIVLLGVSRMTNLPSASLPRQRTCSWLVAFAVAVLVCVYPLVHSILKR